LAQARRQLALELVIRVATLFFPQLHHLAVAVEQTMEAQQVVVQVVVVENLDITILVAQEPLDKDTQVELVFTHQITGEVAVVVRVQLALPQHHL
jgi:hypothetical protein